MTYQELAREVKALPRNQRLELIGVIIETLREEETSKINQEEVPPFSALRGFLKTDGPTPTDEKVDQMRYEYLIEKYS